jgi:hypothetical protein
VSSLPTSEKIAAWPRRGVSGGWGGAAMHGGNVRGAPGRGVAKSILLREGGARLDAEPPGLARVLQRVDLGSRAMDVLRGPRFGWTSTVLCAHVHRVGALERIQPQGALTREHWRLALACPAGPLAPAAHGTAMRSITQR